MAQPPRSWGKKRRRCARKDQGRWSLGSRRLLLLLHGKIIGWRPPVQIDRSTENGKRFVLPNVSNPAQHAWIGVDALEAGRADREHGILIWRGRRQRHAIRAWIDTAEIEHV